ncbi:MAG TPA: ribosome small subunit-dependent GTPase A [Vicinamibacterales bacterium]|nr:ribosome small subunit-dependent GTPase A [Vicinamibacterales bacterium]
MSIDLTALGWNGRLDEAFAPLRADGLVPARVALEHTHIYRVFAEPGEWLARVSGRLRHRAAQRVDFPAVGDWVAVEPPLVGGDARIHSVLPRSSRFSRRAAGDPTEEQIVAANIDTVFLVSGLDGDFNPRRIERYLVVAWESGATPVIVLNKADLVDTPDAIADEVRSSNPGVDVHAVSCRDPRSLEPLREYLGVGKTGALLGSSGVGKSSIVNQLIGQELMRTRDVRTADSRGRHTSTARQLVLLPGHGVLIDTPGMRELQLWDTGESLAGTFAEIEARAADCRFRDCQHRSEPGCAVRAAVAAGEIAAERVESYYKLAAEQAHQDRQKDERAILEEKRRGRIGAKSLRKVLKDKGRT